MRRLQIAMSATGAMFIFALTARAQSSANSSEVYAVSGIARVVQRDLSASPLNFAGYGIDGAFGVAGYSPSFIWKLDFDGGTRTLRSSSGVQPRERVLGAVAAVSALKRATHDSIGAGLSFGVRASGSMSIVTHTYSDPSQRSSDFVLDLVSVGPAIEWRGRLFGGATMIQASTPIASAATHSYSVVNERDLATTTSAAYPNRLRALDATIRRGSVASRRVDAFYVYRIRALRFDDVQPVRAVTQSLSVGGLVRLR